MEKIYKCFISSTYVDLKEERMTVFDTLLKLHHIPAGLENFNASDETQWQYITQILNTCDYFILIVAHRYGTMADKNMSYTQKEATYAKDHDIPVLAFILAEDAEWLDEKREKETKKIELLNEFKATLKTSKIVAEWTNKDDLGKKVSTAMTEAVCKYPRPGYIRGKMEHSGNGTRIIHEVRHPEFRISVLGKEEIKICMNAFTHPEPARFWSLLDPLPLVIPAELEGWVTEREIEEWNSDIPKYNREIEERNKSAARFNEEFLNVFVPLSFTNIGNISAHDIKVKIEFPEWIKIANIRNSVPPPFEPVIPDDPVTAARLKMMKAGHELEDLRQKIEALKRNAAEEVSEQGSFPAGVYVRVASSDMAYFEYGQLPPLFPIECWGLFIRKPEKTGETTVKITCGYDEIQAFQEIHIPISIVKE